MMYVSYIGKKGSAYIFVLPAAPLRTRGKGRLC